MKRFVLDCWITIAWCFPDEQDQYANSVLGTLGPWTAVVPRIWPIEVANALLVAERRGRATSADTSRCLALLRTLPIEIVDLSDRLDHGATLELARGAGLTVYDALYLEVCEQLGLAIATVDQQLLRAATAAGVALYVPSDPAA